MKLSFKPTTKPPKPSIKLSQSQTPQPEYLTEFDSSKPIPTPSSKHPTIIPPKSNEWRPHHTTSLPSPSDDPNLAFESSQPSLDPSDDPNIVYGLNLRDKKVSDNTNDTKQLKSSLDYIMLNRLRCDIDKLPDHKGIEEFDGMDVESFGSAYLGGYGWKEGMGVGRKGRESGDVKVFEFRQQIGRGGLGFVDDVAVPVSNERGRESKSAKIEKSEKEVVRSDGRDRGNKNVERKKENRKRSREGDESGTRSVGRKNMWLSSRIRVRVISKKLKGGRLYLKKGEVLDVVGPTKCDVAMDEGREVVQGVEQEFLETALPRRGGPVLVLYGRYKGVYGTLQEKDIDKETAVVRDVDTHELINVKLEQIAEYVGDPEDIGY